MSRPYADLPQTLQPTRWTWIQLAKNPDAPGAPTALDDLLRHYIIPLRIHIQGRFGVSAEDAADLQQSFVEKRVLQGQLLQKADRGIGKFRTFLFSSVDHFVRDELAKAKAAKCRPPGGLASLDATEGAVEVAAPHTVGHESDRDWVRAVVAQAVEQTRAFYRGKGRPEAWALYEEAKLGPDARRVSLEDLARRHGLQTGQRASNAIVTVERKLGTELFAVIGRYARDEAEIREELRLFIAIFADGSEPPPALPQSSKHREEGEGAIRLDSHESDG
jgi:DNA-directed RNA polymerase specialized sigma24 family protein